MVIERVGIVGAGLMGQGIAKSVARSGVSVTLCRSRSGPTDALRERLAGVSGLRIGDGFADLAGCDLVIESVTEDLQEKRDCFRAVGAVAPDAVLATNTSSLDLRLLAESAAQPSRFIGLHFFNPVHKMHLVEVSPVAQTSAQTLEDAVAFAVRIGKEPVVITGRSVVNRLLTAMFLEAVGYAADAGQGKDSVVSVDRAMKLGANHPMGPFALMDFIGIDVVAMMAVNLFADARYGSRRDILLRMCRRGWKGRKTGIGFYDYGRDPKDPCLNAALDVFA